MFRFNVAVLLLAFVAFASLWSESDGWRRRRRRWWRPVNCEVNGWGNWGGCSNRCGYGYQYRRRYVWRWSQWGGRGCPHLTESRRCGRPNGGCQQICSNGRCSCYGGYYSYGTYYCGDVNECSSNGGRGPCAHLCYNTVGSYYCRCHYGYYLSGRTSCRPVDCGRPNVPNCPGSAYKDQFGTTCQKVIVPSCTTTYLNYCNLQCPSNYRLATIGGRSGYSFGQYYPSVTYQNIPRVQCQGTAKWTNNNLIPSLYCRRINDPPYNVQSTSTRVNEHSPPETVVGTLSANDWQGNTLKYTIEHSKGYYIFDIQGTSLRLKFSPLLNSASKPGVTSPNNQYEVKVRCTDDGSPNMYREKDFYITILDVNDTPYNLRVSSYSVKETVSVNTVVGTLMADDDDGRSSDPHSPCSSWKVEDQSGAFKLKSPNQLIVARPIDHESQKIHPVTVTCVDYDHVSSSGRQQKTASTIINVVIQDEHEAPISTTLSHNDVDENTAVGTTIGTLTASDQDKESLTFSLSPTSYISGADARLFSLGSVSCSNPANGNIRTTCTVDLKVKSKLDWEAIHLILKTPKLIIPALVCVRDTASHTVCTTFQVTIHNVNEAPTNIQLGSATLDENSPPNSVIGNILFTDPDNPTEVFPNGSIIETIHQNPSCVVDTSKAGSHLFTVLGQYPNFYLATASGSSFDYETQSKYPVSVRCDDHGVPNKYLVKDFVVALKDINEAPTAIKLSNMKIKENSGVGTLVGTVSVTDPDKGQTHTCSIVAGNTSTFEFRGYNLVVKSAIIDYESDDEYEITIQCIDNGSPPLSFEDTLDIDVINVLEAPTDIVWATGSCGILPENSDAGFNVGELSVLDQDDNQNPQCKLLDDAGKIFDVQSQNTLIITAGTAASALDYETMANHMLYLTVRCTDTSGQYLDKKMCVNVTDANEPATNISLTANLVRENEYDALIGQLIVTGDPDVGQGHNCTILADTPGVNGHDAKFDAINVFYVEYDASTDTNYLKTISSVDFEALDPAVFDVDIRCFDIPTDGEDPIPIEAYDFKVWMVDVNEMPETPCPQDGSTWMVREGASNGTKVTDSLDSWDPDNEIASEDAKNLTKGQDAPTKQHLTYKLVNGDKVPFVYNEQLQRIEKFGYINFEKTKSYSVCVNVMDDGSLRDPMKTSDDGQPTLFAGQPLNQTYCCPVTVQNAHEPPYKLDLLPAKTCKGGKNAGIDENAKTGTVVATMTTTDQDANDVHTYAIINNNEGDIPLRIDNNNRLVIKSGVDIDFEVTKSFLVTIRTTDQTGFSIERSFQIDVCNVNENATMCLVPTMRKFPENAIGYQIGQIVVNDPDYPSRHCPGPNNIPPVALDPSAPYVYTCRVEAQGAADIYMESLFNVTEKHALVTIGEVNFENRKTFSVPVRCVDLTHPLKHQIFDRFTIDVTNVNEPPYNVHVVANLTSTMPSAGLTNCSCKTIFEVVENMETDIAKLAWMDQDRGQDHEVMVQGFFSNRFVFNYRTNVLSTTGLSHETNQGCYNVTVTDNGNPKMSGSMTLCIFVQNVPEAATAIRVLCPDSKFYGRPAKSPTDENTFTSLARKDYSFGVANSSGDCRLIRQCDLKDGTVVGTIVPLDEDQSALFTFSNPAGGVPFKIGTLLDGNLNVISGGHASAARLEATGKGIVNQMPIKTYPIKIAVTGDDGLTKDLWITVRAYNDCDSTFGTPVPCGANASLIAGQCSTPGSSGGCRCVCNAKHVGDPATGCKPCPRGQKDGAGNVCVDIDECESNPCQNGATCLNGNDKYDCLCDLGYEGMNCETQTDYCSPNPCKNDGQCVNQIGQAMCVCGDGFTGQYCDLHTGYCSDQNLCSAAYTCVFSNRETCVDHFHIAQTYAEVPSTKLQSNAQKYALENYVETFLQFGRIGYSLEASLDAVSSRRKRAEFTYSVVTVGFKPWKGMEDERTFFELAVFNRSKQWQPVPVSAFCDLLKGSDLQCVSYDDCLTVNQLGKKCNPASIPATIETPSSGAALPNVIIGPHTNIDHEPSTDEKTPFFGTLTGIIVIVAICVAVIIVASVTIFVVVRRRRRGKGSYYEEFDDYDGSMAGMPDESTHGNFPAMSGSMRERARGRPRSGLVNPLYDAVMAGDEEITGTVQNELYAPSDQIKVFDQGPEGVSEYTGDTTGGGFNDDDIDPLYDRVN